ncbi:DUF5986 family protein [uncultured Phascolarctobacterium sp.]|uniref:DUF5986 family protein n=1 Tax=uncultured Phascolarctobacterium sp. TaxID=512296 RepID=UPI00262183AA|nr:DUF5986 family protein [uncultured Phascolarctobacterium sp.]
MSIHLDNCFTNKGKQGLCDFIQSAIESRNQILQGHCTQNSKPNLFWDELFKLIMDKMESDFGVFSCEPFVTNRGCWKFALLYSDGIIFSVMREQRFEELQKELRKNSKSPHYAASLARILNIDAPNMQESLFYDIDDEVYKRSVDITNKLLQKLDVESEYIEGYVMILFDADDTQLYSARMAFVNRNLEVCDEYSLKDYIHIKEPVIVESTNEYPNRKPEDPSKGLKLTSKAAARKAKKQNILQQNSAAEVNENIK